MQPTVELVHFDGGFSEPTHNDATHEVFEIMLMEYAF